MTLVVDASVALKWVLEEAGRAEALSLIGGTDPLAAPDFLWLECANVLAAKVTAGRAAQEAAAYGLEAIQAAPVRIISSRPHLGRAHAIAVELGQSAYDSLYLTLALEEGAVLITADARFARAVREHPAYQASIRLL